MDFGFFEEVLGFGVGVLVIGYVGSIDGLGYGYGLGYSFVSL